MTSKEALKLIYDNHQKREFQNQVLIDAAYQVIEKDLEVLEILKNKMIDLGIARFENILDEYNNHIEFYNFQAEHRSNEIVKYYDQVTEKEFNLIKDWLNHNSN